MRSFRSEYRVWSIEYREMTPFRVAGGGWREENIFGSRVSGDRASGTGYQVRVRVRVLNLHLVLKT